MLTIDEFKGVMRNKLKDAVSLYQKRRYDAAVYLCGYAVEIALKIRICQLMGWTEFPETNAEFNKNERYKFIKCHTSELLLAYSGLESAIKDPNGPHKSKWDKVEKWNPEERYSSVGAMTKLKASAVLSATQNLIQFLAA